MAVRPKDTGSGLGLVPLGGWVGGLLAVLLWGPGWGSGHMWGTGNPRNGWYLALVARNSGHSKGHLLRHVGPRWSR